MSVVSLLGVRVVNNPAPFTAPYEFEITFECLEQLQKGELSCTVERGRLLVLCANIMRQISSGSSLMLALQHRKRKPIYLCEGEKFCPKS